MPQEGLDLLFTSQRTNDGEETGYGIGWRVATLGAMFPEGNTYRTGEHSGLRVVQHGGSSVGGRALLMVIPEERMVIALLVNYGRFGGAQLGGQVAMAFLEN